MAEIITVFYSLKGQTIAPGMKIVDLKKGILRQRQNLSRKRSAATFLR